jgi:hypothetical protein
MWAGLHLDFPEVFDQPAHITRERVPDRPDRYGRWAGLVRELADQDHEKAQRILRWPLREALHAYRSRMRQYALEDYRHRLIVWAITAPYVKGADRRAPALPAILRGMIDGDA